MESSGLYNQRQLIVNVNSRANKNFSLTGSYSLNHAMSNTDGLGTFPANPYSIVIGNITSPLFGRANQPAGGGGFSGFSEAANNRRLKLQARFTF